MGFDQLSSEFAPRSSRIAHARWQIDADSRPSALGPPFTGHFRVMLDTPRGLQPLHPGRKTSTTFPYDGKSQEANKEQTSQFTLGKNIYQQAITSKDSKVFSADAALATLKQDEDHKPEPTRYTCDVCGTDCTRTRYHSIKQREFEICPQCYSEGRFPSNLFTGDFVRMDQLPHETGNATDETVAGTPWTDQERLLLLEGLEMFDDDWDKIVNHVGGLRTKQECIAHFLQLPIEDKFLAQNEADLGPLQYNRIPLSQSDNPVLGVVAFLASVVDPKVAASAAGSAISELTAALKPSANGRANGAESSSSDVKANEPAIQKASAAALGAAAAKAQLLGATEDAALHGLVRQVVEAQVNKLELKMAQFEELESQLEAEKRAVEAIKAQLAEERLAVSKASSAIAEYSKRVAQQLQSPQALANPGMAMHIASSVPNDLQNLIATNGMTAGQPPRLQQIDPAQLGAAAGLPQGSYTSL
jgi:SWI/SNF related-matrix-associated actin-dependent regulator of chromatin subfamily C